MDGTLTLAVHDFDAIRRELGITADKPILEAIEEMSAEQATSTMQLLNEIEMEIAASSTAQPGATELLAHLQNQHCTLGILTRNGCEIAAKTLQAAGIAEYFEPDTILGRESCRPKPDPAGIELLLKKWGSAVTETVMVGDYKFDLEAGANAGVTTVHLDVNDGEQWPSITNFRVGTLQELHQLV